MARYVFVEQNQVNGKTTRVGGTTRRSLAAMKHLPKVGEVLHVRGYIYSGRHDMTHVGVLVVGTKGSIRFGGFSWGYVGEGSRGLQSLFDAIGILANSATVGRWPEFSEVGEHWRINKGEA